MSKGERRDNGPATFLRRFPIWPGVVAAVLVFGALAGASARGLVGESMSGLAGGLVSAVHALTVLAVVTTLGQAAKIAGWGRELEECRQLPDDERTGWPIHALDDALKRLYRRHSTAELHDEIRKTEGLILERQHWTWRLPQFVAFVLPAVGFAASLWNLRWEGNKLPYRELGWPLLIALGEAIVVLLLALWVRGAAESLLREWRLLCQEVCAVRRPHGEIDDEHEEEEEEQEAPEPKTWGEPTTLSTATPSQKMSHKEPPTSPRTAPSKPIPQAGPTPVPPPETKRKPIWDDV